MTEVVTFEQVRRRAQPWTGGDDHKGRSEFFNRDELNSILQVYSRRVMAGDWLDYALGWDERGAVFAIYGATSSLPVYSIIKRARQANCRSSGPGRARPPGSARRCGVLVGALGVLESRRPKLVEEG